MEKEYWIRDCVGSFFKEPFVLEKTRSTPITDRLSVACGPDSTIKALKSISLNSNLETQQSQFEPWNRPVSIQALEPTSFNSNYLTLLVLLRSLNPSVSISALKPTIFNSSLQTHQSLLKWWNPPVITSAL